MLAPVDQATRLDPAIGGREVDGPDRVVGGEYAFDVPHLFGTRRIGPDLTRVGLKYGDEWHYAHFWNPRMLSEDSIMQPGRGLFEAPEDRIKIVDDGAGNRTDRIEGR